jgi:hypothetical protein
MERVVFASPNGVEWRQLRPVHASSLILPGGDATDEIGDTTVGQLDGDLLEWAAPWASSGTPVAAERIDGALTVITQSSWPRAEASVLRNGVWSTIVLPAEFGWMLSFMSEWDRTIERSTMPVIDGRLVIQAKNRRHGLNMWTSADGLNWSRAAQPAAFADFSDSVTRISAYSGDLTPVQRPDELPEPFSADLAAGALLGTMIDRPLNTCHPNTGERADVSRCKRRASRCRRRCGCCQPSRTHPRTRRCRR